MVEVTLWVCPLLQGAGTEISIVGEPVYVRNVVQRHNVVLEFELAQLVDQVRSKHESLNVMEGRGSSSTLGQAPSPVCTQ